MPRASSFVRWMVQALIVGLLALHLPLDAVRPHGPGPAVGARPVAKPCAAGCCAPAPAPGSALADDGATPALDDDGSPAPQDGCDPGCHCGCCGGVPLVAEVRPVVALEATSAPRLAPARSTARGARRLEIFHPPRA